MSALWLWLDTNSKQITTLCAMLFGASGVGVTWLAFQLNYFGWRPIVIVKGRGAGASADGAYAYTSFEVWNRRKYPIVIRIIEVDLGQTRIASPAHDRNAIKEWTATSQGTLHLEQEKTIKPGEAETYEVRGTGRPIPAVDAFDAPDVSVRVLFFDPGRNKLLGIIGDSFRWDKNRQILGRLNRRADRR